MTCPGGPGAIKYPSLNKDYKDVCGRLDAQPTWVRNLKKIERCNRTFKARAQMYSHYYLAEEIRVNADVKRAETAFDLF